MMLPFLFKRLGLAVLLVASTVRAQFYAPETQFHDLCQRHFAVEATRVLAWLEHQGNTPVASITYELKKTGAVENEWQLRWLDAKGQELRTTAVRYPTAALTNGIGFYREVFRQLGGRTNALSGKTVAAAVLEKAFWEGADRAGFSRMESLENAFDLWKMKKGQLPTPEEAARLAGLLAQTTTHGFWQESALDGRLLARAAAWLCVAESAGSASDNLWSPILFVAGREWQAGAVWSSRKSPPVAEWWNVMLTGTSAKDAFVFVAAAEQRSRAMPMMAWQGSISDGYTSAAGHLIEPIFGGRKFDYHRLYDYAPGFADSTIENGHILNGWWPVLARAAWVKTLKAYPPSDLDYQGYLESLNKVAGTLKGVTALQNVDERDNSTQQLDVVNPLLRVAYNESTGALTPVAHVTARDLLHFGWENAALQLVARHYFVLNKWNVRELAHEIHKAGTNHIPQLGVLMSFATNSAKATALNRLQYVNWTFGGNWSAAGLKTRNTLTNDASGMFTHWLRPSMASWLYNWWFWGHKEQERQPIMAALNVQGGRRMNLKMLNFLVSDSQSKQEVSEVGSRLTNGLSFATDLMSRFYRRTNPDTNWTGVPSPEECRRVEALFLTNPDSPVASDVFHMYLLAGEFPAAKSFYDEVMLLPYDAVSYSTRMESPRWILAMFENDTAAMRQVLTEHNSGSMTDFIVRIYDALYRENYRAAEKIIQEGIARYGAGRSNSPSTLEIIRQVLTMREALANPADPGHEKAISSSASAASLPMVQWLLIKNLKLSPEDAIKFLGGKKSRGLKNLFVCYLEKDKLGFADTFRKLEDLPPITCAVAGWLRADLFNRKPTMDAALIRANPVKPVEELVMERLRQSPIKSK